MKQNTKTNLVKRTKRTKNFTVVGNEIFDCPELSLEAMAILIYVLSLPDDWMLHKTVLQKKFKVGRRIIDRAFREIETAGYMHSLEMIKIGNKFVGRNYMFYDNPTKRIPDVHFGTTQNEQAQNVQVIRTNSNQELIQPNKHTPTNDVCDVSFLGSSIDSNSTNSKKPKNTKPKWLAKIQGSVGERFKEFERKVKAEGKRANVDDEICEQLITKYGADDKEFEGYMMFETYRYFDYSLMLRRFDGNRRDYAQEYADNPHKRNKR